jgi:hypothetical protein
MVFTIYYLRWYVLRTFNAGLSFDLLLFLRSVCDYFKVMQKGKKAIICKNIFKNHFEFSVTKIRTRAQGFKSKTLTHPAIEVYTIK